jgi:hypothetical protein
MAEPKVIEIVIFYTSPSKGGTFSFVGTKERKRVSLTIAEPLTTIIKTITDQAGLIEEAEKRGLSKYIDVKLARVDKSTCDPKVYVISTIGQELTILEK